ncbi:PAAR domain-containing protein [Paraburkholderia sp. J69-1]|nr:PAAR domain-containing protein [Paraburkholderia sp. J69-1]
MRRALLREGDRTTAGGTVQEGIGNRTVCGKPVAFIGARIWCPACNSEGVVAWVGPHQTSTMNGRQQALDGDECACKCSPPPTCIASQDLAWHCFEADEWTAGSSNDSSPASEFALERYDEQFELLNQSGEPMRGVRYRILAGSQILVSGTTDPQGRTQRIKTSDVRGLRLDIIR